MASIKFTKISIEKWNLNIYAKSDNFHQLFR